MDNAIDWDKAAAVFEGLPFHKKALHIAQLFKSGELVWTGSLDPNCAENVKIKNRLLDWIEIEFPEHLK